jgi:hypothetical protein
MHKFTLIQICLFLSILLVGTQLHSQEWNEDQDLGIWYDDEGNRLEIAMVDESVCSFKYINPKGEKKGDFEFRDI